MPPPVPMADDYTDNDFTVRDHCHITGRYRGSAYRDCNISLKLNHKILVIFYHLIMQEIGKFNLKKNVTPNRLKKYMSFTINNKSSVIDSFQSLSSSLDSSVKNLNKDNCKYLSQEFDNNVLDLVKQKGFYPYEYISDFEKFKEEIPSKRKFHILLIDRNIRDKEYEHVLNVWNKFEMKTIKNYHDLYIKCKVLLLADVFEKFRNKSLKN